MDMQTTVRAYCLAISFQIERSGLLVAGEGLTADLQPLSTVLCVGAQEAQLRETRRGPALRQLPLASRCPPPPKYLN